MKASELMVGDWVNLSKGNFSENRQVGLVDIEMIAESVYLAEPIPLTPEILEKNGFKFDGSGQCSMMFLSEPRYSEGQRFNIYVGFKHKTIEVFVAHPIEKSPNWRKINKAYLEVCGPYVHELQHALRLCGIDLDIVI